MQLSIIQAEAKKFAKDFTTDFKNGNIPLVASSLAYTTILSIIPLLAVSFAIFQAFGGMDKLYAMIEPMILENLAEGTSDQAIDTIRKLIGNAHAGAVGITGLVGLLFTSMSMLSSIEKAINRIWNAPHNRPLFYQLASYWLFITLGPVALSVVVGASTSSQMQLTQILPSGASSILFLGGFFGLLYKFVPNRKVSWISAIVGASFTAVFWNVARAGYSLYTHTFMSANKIYGSLAAVPIILLWIYILWVVILTGAALSCSVQKQLEVKLPRKEKSK